MKVINIVEQRKREDDYYDEVISILKRLRIFKVSYYHEYRLKIKLKTKGFFDRLKARITVDYGYNTIDADVAYLSEEELKSIKTALKEIESLRKKTKVTLTIEERL